MYHGKSYNYMVYFLKIFLKTILNWDTILKQLFLQLTWNKSSLCM